MELGGCPDRWIDVFISKAADDPTTRVSSNTNEGDKYTYDDEFCATVQSIEFDPSDANTAYITTNSSEWILPTWSDEYGAAAASPYASLQVGDLVRIGGIKQKGFTDYLTIVEIKHVTHLANATDGIVSFSRQTPITGREEGTHYLAAPLANPPSTYTLPTYTLPTTGISHIAIRLNASLDATAMPDHALDRSATLATHKQGVDTSNLATLATRHHAYEYGTRAASAYPTESSPSEHFYYPLYRAKKWTHGKELIARLDHGVKQVSAVKLLGYSLVNKRQVGIQHAHEMQADDYLIMRIKEIEGHVISNNQYANGAFAILRAGDTSNSIIGAAEFSSYEPMGIVCVPVHATNSTLRNMTVEITDRLGRPAHFGRLHLWFKLLVTHG